MIQIINNIAEQVRVIIDNVLAGSDVILIICGILLLAIHRVLRGVERGAFYAKGKEQDKYHLSLTPYIKNIHRIETPLWYAKHIGIFVLIAGLTAYAGLWSLIFSLLCVMAMTNIASPFRQGFINYSEGSPFINPDENKKSEFMDWFWWKRPLSGKGRIIVSILGAVWTVLAIVVYIRYIKG